MAPRFCASCGAPLTEGARFCASCGASLPTLSQGLGGDPAAAAHPPFQTPPSGETPPPWQASPVASTAFDAPPPHPPYPQQPQLGQHEAPPHGYGHDPQPGFPPHYGHPRKSRKRFYIAGAIALIVFILLYLSPVGTGWFGPDRPFGPGAPPGYYPSASSGQGSGSQPTSGAATEGQGSDLDSLVMGRWCGDGGSTSTFGANAAWTNYNPSQGSQPGTWQIIGQDRLILRQNGAVATMRFTISGNSMTLTDTARGGAPMTITRC